ncbi:protein PHOX1 [Dendrobium catenatum]|uniref:TPR repeat-containing thioredoxin TTL4 n=1 Tax=Dendrobium catenatum TaxID=906689 RepID=A0A2I0WFI5_9ASPA|nr:protein PHOX1 [Dendrobium catenatum]XP_020679099.1 protein PHOX1 [Dendrobium catenatum]XP_028552777.1 protein PHOX1 [Dendrobium catenatum]XP_028552778.1 protein PHOX1 [Dendrobium catenatum]XP_028552779.1 protein PHOX1 [Dendrobium catenatum]XP_028552781.1 protein PHOX1 [Dendrobium catenatum]XP_028552782.1 protein PHOX1 [Dendrobium catenatum]PKU74420.1 TPR repeat-containing thioredoxin TTL4 [Dendrobium catenatum]
MGKPAAKKKKSLSVKSADDNSKKNRSTVHGPKAFDEDTAIFIDMANDMKDEGNKLFQKRDYDGALVKYEKAIKLLPKNHIDVAYLHSNLAACYMQMGPEEYHKAIHECNLALEVSPKYTKALLKRARCLEALNRLELAYKDVDAVLSLEPNNLTALEVSDKIKKALEVKGIQLNDKEVILSTEIIPVREKTKKKKNNKTVDKVVVEEKTLLEKPVSVNPVAEKPTVVKEEPLKAVKLVFGEDIRFARIPGNCSLSQLREIVRNRFPSLKAVLIKYRDKEGDLVTITTSEELRWADESADPQGSLRLYVSEVKPEHEPLFDDGNKNSEVQVSERNLNGVNSNGRLGNAEEQKNSFCINEWIVEFALLFKNHVGVDSDAYLDLHQLGMKLYSEAMEDTVTSEEAMEVFDVASTKFQEMAALALFNLGNVHMSRARKKLFLTENDSKDVTLTKVKSAYEWAKGEYEKAGSSYEEAMKIKPDFYEGFLALAHQQFEHAKLTWYFAIGNMADLDTWPSKEVLLLFNNAEDNMERGTEIWEEMEEKRLKARLKPNKEKVILEKLGLGQFFKEFSTDETAEISSNMRSQLHILWGRILYERSIVEFKLSLPTWEECLMAAVEKFKLAGASPTDIAVMIKNHCANETTQEGLGFKIDEIVQAWNEMYDAKRWMSAVPSLRLEPLFRRRTPKLHHSLEQLEHA